MPTGFASTALASAKYTRRTRSLQRVQAHALHARRLVEIAWYTKINAMDAKPNVNVMVFNWSSVIIGVVATWREYM